MEYIRISKFLSLLLRHAPGTIHLTMDKNGWVEIQELIDNAGTYKNMRLTYDMIIAIVKTDEKQRYAVSDDGKYIRANQGHSITVDVELIQQTPPNRLYHGTASRFLNSILRDGLKPMSRQYVHLSPTKDIALNVGKRHGRPVVLYIDAKTMYAMGYIFYLSKNNVWLVESVPPQYIHTSADEE